MTDPPATGAALRATLHARAEALDPRPDAAALFERTARAARRRGRRVVVFGAAAVVAVGTAGVLGGQALASPEHTTSAATAPQGPRSSSAASAAPTGGPVGASVVPDVPLTHLFSRTTAEGITIRTYVGPTTPAATCPSGCANGAGSDSSGVGPSSSPTTGPAGATPNGATPNGAASSGPVRTLPVMTEPLVTVPPVGAPATTSTSAPTTGDTSCATQPLTVELSDAAAVATAAATATTPIAGQLVVVASGTFGSPEGGPASWVLVSVGADVASVQLGAGGDAMAPVDGLAVLAASGASTGPVTARDPNGAVLATASVSPAPVPVPAPTATATTGCSSTGAPTPTSTPTSTTPTMVTTTVPTPVPDPPVNPPANPPGTGLPVPSGGSFGSTGPTS